MRIRHLAIENFRGIEELDWTISRDVVALIGRGDAGKTTILEAMGWALSATWWLPISEADFTNGDVSKPITISATLIDLPVALTSFDAFGMQMRGWDGEAGVVTEQPEPDNKVVPALTIRLTIDDSFEPIWHMVKGDDEIRVGSSHRARLGFFRIDDRSERHLAWGRGSALSALTGSTDDIPAALAAAHRQARATVRQHPPPDLQKAATEVQKRGALWGVPVDALRPGLSPTTSSGAASMVLHEADIPVTQMGLGSVRALAMAVQGLGADGAIVAVDEVELGLEPHRLRQLIHRLTTTTSGDDHESPDQIFLTTHSPVAITELDLDHLHVVRRDGHPGEVGVLSAGDTFDDPDAGQGLARSSPESFLSRAVIVGEGATEVGLTRALLRNWEGADGLMSTRAGVATCDGDGDPKAQKRALAFDELGYDTILMLDSDRGSAEVLEAAGDHGVSLIQWSGNVCLEQRVAEDMPDSFVSSFVDAARDAGRSLESIRDKLADQLHVPPGQLGSDPSAWLAKSGQPSHEFRLSLGDAATKGKWFKSIAGGELLGNAVLAHWPDFDSGSDLVDKLSSLKAVIHGLVTPSSDNPPAEATPNG